MAVDPDVAVADQLAGGGAALGEAEEVDHAVEAGLEELQETLAGDAALALGGLEGLAELALEQAVDVAELLLLVQADGELRQLAAEFGAVLAGGIGTTLIRLGGAEERGVETTAESGGGAGVAGHDGCL